MTRKLILHRYNSVVYSEVGTFGIQMNGDLLWAFASNNPYYSTNLQVHGHGSSSLPMLYSIPATGYISVAVTVQNHRILMTLISC